MSTSGNIIIICVALAACILGFSLRGVPATPEHTKIRNLRAFSKLYGYVKYFHPSDEASQVDWDMFAIYGAGKVKGAGDSKELEGVLKDLFMPIAPTILIYQAGHEPQTPMLDLPEDTAGLEVVAWQHKGVGLQRGSRLYQSCRLNRGNGGGGGDHGFGTVVQSVDAKAYRGKEIILKAFVRTNVSGTGNQGQLWLRIDRAGGQHGFFDNMDDRPIKSAEWKAYEIRGRVADDAESIVFGCFLAGHGQVWADEFQLLTSSDGQDWHPIEVRNPGFEDLKRRNKPSHWGFASPGYTHRADKENPYEGSRCLLIEDQVDARDTGLFEEHPQVGEAIQKPLDAGLFCHVPLALYSDENGTLGSTRRESLDGLLAELKNLADRQLTADDEDVRLGDVTLAWNVFNHFYPYFNVVNVDWDTELTDALHAALADRSERDFFNTLRRLVARLQDGHGQVKHKLQEGWAGFPFVAELIEDRVVVTYSTDTSNFQVGDVLVAIDGVDAKAAWLEEEQYASGSPQWRRCRVSRTFGYGAQGTTARVVVERDGETMEIEAARSHKDLRPEPTRPDIEEIVDGVFYVNLTRAEMTSIRERMDEIAGAKGVIFDLRGYPKGNHEVISHLLEHPDTSTTWMRIPKIIYPDYENVVGFEDYGWEVPLREPRIRGTVAFLTDGRAISYAESFLSFIEHYKLGEIVGRPTAGTNGNVNALVLPGGFKVFWTGMKVVKHDGSQHHLIGILPTVPVERTVAAVKEGRDEFLEKALALINQ
jgi:C-terminal processing protease CtpA/Prc